VSQLSETTPSQIGALYLTDDTLVTGTMHRATFRTAAWSPIGRSVRRCVGGTETQEIDRGGDDGTLNWPVELEFDWMHRTLYWALRAQCDAVATLYAATLVLTAKDEAGAEVTHEFAALRWVALTYDTEARHTGDYFRSVLATLTSEE
jgi:hypothetical protein